MCLTAAACGGGGGNTTAINAGTTPLAPLNCNNPAAADFNSSTCQCQRGIETSCPGGPAPTLTRTEGPRPEPHPPEPEPEPRPEEP